MNLARQINEKLDEISRHNQERNAVEADFQDPPQPMRDMITSELRHTMRLKHPTHLPAPVVSEKKC